VTDRKTTRALLAETPLCPGLVGSTCRRLTTTVVDGQATCSRCARRAKSEGLSVGLSVERSNAHAAWFAAHRPRRPGRLSRLLALLKRQPTAAPGPLLGANGNATAIRRGLEQAGHLLPGDEA
jgi:hypothetical protein